MDWPLLMSPGLGLVLVEVVDPDRLPLWELEQFPGNEQPRTAIQNGLESGPDGDMGAGSAQEGLQVARGIHRDLHGFPGGRGGSDVLVVPRPGVGQVVRVVGDAGGDVWKAVGDDPR